MIDSTFGWAGKLDGVEEDGDDEELPMGRATLKLQSAAILEAGEARPGRGRAERSPQGENAFAYAQRAPVPPSHPLSPSCMSHQQMGKGVSSGTLATPQYSPAYMPQPGGGSYSPAYAQQPFAGAIQPRAGAIQPPAALDGKGNAQWNLTPEMMNQRWGTVLRTLNRR